MPSAVLVEIASSAGAALLVLLVAWRRSAGERATRAGAAVALAAGFLASFWIALGLPPAPSRDLPVAEWSFYVALAGCAAGVAISYRPRGRLLVVAALSLAASRVVLAPRDASWGTAAAAAAPLAAWWLALDAIAVRVPAPAPPLLLALAAGAGAQACVLAHTAKVGQLSAAMGAALGVAGLLALARKRGDLARGGTAVAAPVLGVLWVVAAEYADLPRESALLLAAAPLAAIAARFGRVGAAGALLLAAGACALALWLAREANPPDPYGYF